MHQRPASISFVAWCGDTSGMRYAALWRVGYEWHALRYTVACGLRVGNFPFFYIVIHEAYFAVIY